MLYTQDINAGKWATDDSENAYRFVVLIMFRLVARKTMMSHAISMYLTAVAQLGLLFVS